MAYTPSVPPPIKTADELRSWLERELTAIARSLQNFETIQLVVLGAPPIRIQDGMVAFADGTSWDPGSGRGPYVFSSGSWVPLV